MCSNQSLCVVGSLSTPCSGVSCLNICHRIVFVSVMWSCLGQKNEHNNSSPPLATSTDGSAPSPRSISAAITVGLASRKVVKHPYFLFGVQYVLN